VEPRPVIPVTDSLADQYDPVAPLVGYPAHKDFTVVVAPVPVIVVPVVIVPAVIPVVVIPPIVPIIVVPAVVPIVVVPAIAAIGHSHSTGTQRGRTSQAQ
jgi:signal-induced proliferation-associated 1 like protein 3